MIDINEWTGLQSKATMFLFERKQYDGKRSFLSYKQSQIHNTWLLMFWSYLSLATVESKTWTQYNILGLSNTKIQAQETSKLCNPHYSSLKIRHIDAACPSFMQADYPYWICTFLMYLWSSAWMRGIQG